MILSLDFLCEGGRIDGRAGKGARVGVVTMGCEENLAGILSRDDAAGRFPRGYPCASARFPVGELVAFLMVIFRLCAAPQRSEHLREAQSLRLSHGEFSTTPRR